MEVAVVVVVGPCTLHPTAWSGSATQVLARYEAGVPRGRLSVMRHTPAFMAINGAVINSHKFIRKLNANPHHYSRHA